MTFRRVGRPRADRGQVEEDTKNEFAETPLRWGRFTRSLTRGRMNRGTAIMLTEHVSTSLTATAKASTFVDGVVTFAVAPSPVANSGILVGVDGVGLPVVWGTAPNAKNIAIDTRKLADGPHRVVLNVARNDNGAWTFAGHAAYTFTSKNGGIDRRILPNYDAVYLGVGESVALGQRVQTCDGKVVTRTAMGFTSSNPAIVSVTTGGTVKRIAPGMATITITQTGLDPVTVRVLDRQTGFAHFAKDGRIVTTYGPDSLFVISCFASANMTLADLKAKGFNCQEFGFTANLAASKPADTEAEKTRIVAEYAGRNTQRLNALKAEGMVAIIAGDDAIRQPAEATATFKMSIGRAVHSEIAQRTAAAGGVVGVAIVDESVAWGDAHRQSLGFATWADFRAAVAAMYAPSGLATFWPRPAPASVMGLRDWCGNDRVLNLFSTDFSVAPGTYDAGYGRTPWHAASIFNRQWWNTFEVYGARPVIGHAGISTWTGTANAMMTPEAVYANVLIPALLGCAGVRVYREAWEPDPSVWAGVSNAAALIHKHAAKLLQPITHTPHFALGVFATARKGANGAIVIAYNSGTAAITTTVDFTALGGGVETVTLAGYETRVWEF